MTCVIHAFKHDGYMYMYVNVCVVQLVAYMYMYMHNSTQLCVM